MIPQKSDGDAHRQSSECNHRLGVAGRGWAGLGVAGLAWLGCAGLAGLGQACWAEL